MHYAIIQIIGGYVEMKQKILSALLVATMSTTLLLSGCGSNESKTAESEESTAKSELVIPVATDISSFYTVGLDDTSNEIISPAFDNLFTVVDGETIDYKLAESCELSEDGKTYTVKLHEGVTWSDGEALDADDIVFSMVTADQYGYYPYFAATEITVEKVDDYTVTITLAEPNNSFMQRIGTCKPMPSHLYEGVEGDEIFSCEGAMSGVGSGPYKLVEWNQGESIIYEARDDYYGEEPSIKRVVFKVMPDASAQELAFKNGEVNMIRVSTKDQLETYKGDEDYTVFNIPENRVNMLVVNASSKKITSLEAKQAIFAAIDTQEICDQVYGSDELAKPAGGMYSEGTQYFDHTLSNYTYDLEEAKTLADKSGLTGETLTLMYFSDRENMENYAMVIQQQLKEIGIKVELVGTELNTGMTEFQMGTDKYDLVLNGWDGMQGSPGAQWAFYSTGSGEAFYGFSENSLKLLKQAMVASTDDEMTECYSEFQKSCMEDYWAYPLVETNYVMATQKGYKGLDTVPIVPVFADWTKLSIE